MYDESTGFRVRPPTRVLAWEHIKSDGAYIMDCGEMIYLYLGHKVDENFIYNIFGYANFHDMKFNGVE